MAETLFWASVALVFYAYLGYPCALMALSVVRHRRVRKGAATPPVTFIITAHNEAGRIQEKLDNTLAQDYPGSVEIIVASDCSTDGTDDIVCGYAPRVRLVRSPERRGKEAAQQLAIAVASGEVLVFSDVATALDPDGIATLVANFADPTVGCVSSIDRFVDADGRISGEGAYVRYEMFLRELETRVNSLVGLSGSLFAARRDVCHQWASDRQSDFSTLLNSVASGLRGVSDPQSAGYYRNLRDDRLELQRKIRTVVRGIAVLVANVRMLNPLRYPLFSWQLASHKLCRWLVPFAMITAVIANVVLIHRSGLYPITMGMQLGFYAVAAVGLATGARNMRIPAYLVLANFAVLAAWFRYARGERMTTWSPSERLNTLPRISTP
jgi:glycosyltransferase involved in cell wall biosynthesis